MNKVVLDSNIFIRHLTQDSKELSPRATRLFEEIAKSKILGYVTGTTLHEVTYVLRKVYGQTTEDISGALVELLKLKNIEVLGIPKDPAIEALGEYGNHSLDFADILLKHWAKVLGCSVASFDKDMQAIDAPLYPMLQ